LHKCVLILNSSSKLKRVREALQSGTGPPSRQKNNLHILMVIIILCILFPSPGYHILFNVDVHISTRRCALVRKWLADLGKGSEKWQSRKFKA